MVFKLSCTHLGMSKKVLKKNCLVLSSRESDWSGVWLEWTSQVSLVVKNPMQEMHKTQAGSLGQQDPLEEGWHPLQCSCLENPMDRGAWSARVQSAAQSQTQLK